MKKFVLMIPVILVLFSSCNNIFLALLGSTAEDMEQNKYLVIFDKNGGEKEARPNRRVVTLPATSVNALPLPPEWSGHGFLGWNTEPDGSGTGFTAATNVVSLLKQLQKPVLVVYAQWLNVP